ncbi:MAG: NTP transferase domain-containing protein [Candidatus Methylacidiphilales bacterium]
MKPPGLILLAAGGSTRMKRPKQLLAWGAGSTLLQHACNTALQTQCHPVLVVLGCEAEACRGAIASLPIATVVHPEWRQGIGSTISAGITALESADPDASGALILLVDQPGVTPALLSSLIAAWSPPHHPIAATSYEGAGGVPAVFDRTLFPKLKALDPERGARSLIARNIAHTALIHSGSTLFDLDTPEVYAAESKKWRDGLYEV